ncbi:histone deacetylase HDT1-like isoform X2 [Andrographis paniculata]|uniref:histone deacetylase HDT1-like isoform X2 n=1 Tax=Andrographis paniculata TaxID=175694 RepID=UPI0021E868CD|nr:histone deacetylase HDT1-like isoform X2 [Andrographis paniculata]
MEFWGVEVKPGQSLKVQPELGKLIHISQAAMGEVKDAKGAKNVPLRLKIDDKKFIIGSLAAEDRTQIMFDLVFERDFELSHDWKNGSVYFMGYMADDPVSDGEDFSGFEDESEDEPIEAHENGGVIAKADGAKPGKIDASKPGLDEDDSESDSDDSMGEGDDSDEDSEDDDISSEEEIDLSKKSKKRSAEPAAETPVPAKKAKPAATPNKTGNKKEHEATPIPSKATGKTPNSNKPKDQTPKSAGPSCKSCSKTFASEKALESHTKAKHGGK